MVGMAVSVTMVSPVVIVRGEEPHEAEAEPTGTAGSATAVATPVERASAVPTAWTSSVRPLPLLGEPTGWRRSASASSSVVADLMVSSAGGLAGGSRANWPSFQDGEGV